MEFLISQMSSLLNLFSIFYTLLPSPISAAFRSLHDFLTPYTSLRIPEFNSSNCVVDVNHLYHHVTLYLNSLKSSPAAGANFTLSTSGSSNRISCSVGPDHTVHDSFNGYRLTWTHHIDDTHPDSSAVLETRSFVLKLPKRRRHALLAPYIQHVTARAEEIERVSRERHLYTNNGFGSWYGFPFRHPSTFETLALEPDVKSQIVDDLTAFVEGKEFYRRIGRPWKRGYLFYGPPGSGKSSLVAAMANHLNYDVYDLDLTKVADNGELTSLLRQTNDRSIVVIEDINSAIDDNDVSAGEDEVSTLSKVMNLMSGGGLWSCWCGEGRVMVLTTKEEETARAVVRGGGVEVEVRLGRCGEQGLRTMVRNYLGVERHDLLQEMNVAAAGELMPAEVGEILWRNRRDADVAVKAVVSAMLQQQQQAG